MSKRYQQDDANPNKGTDRGRRAVSQSLERLGGGRSALVDKDGNIVGGNKTIKAAEALGMEFVEVEIEANQLLVAKRKDLDLYDPEDRTAREMSIADNRSAELGLAWDVEVMNENLELLGTVGFSDKEAGEFKALMDQMRPLPDVYDAPIELADLELFYAKWESEEGSLWKMGHHWWLSVGDMTNPEVVANLFSDAGYEGRLANLTLTSPPYWLGLEYEEQRNEAEIDQFIGSAVDSIVQWSDKTNGRVIINTGTAMIHRVDTNKEIEVLPLIDKWGDAMREHGWLMRHMRVWSKIGGLGAPSIGPKQDVVDQHNEFIAMFINPDPDYGYILTYWNPEGGQRGQNRTNQPWAQQGIWTDVKGQRGAGKKHLAAMSLGIAERNIQLYSLDNELIFEPFCGSGTTIIAAYKWDRACLAIEKNPLFAAACLERLQQSTDLAIERVK